MRRLLLPDTPGAFPSATFPPGAFPPDGSTTGDAGNVQFRYDPTYMQMAADGEL